MRKLHQQRHYSTCISSPSLHPFPPCSLSHVTQDCMSMSHKRENNAWNPQSQWRIPGKTHCINWLGEIWQWQWLHSGNTAFLCQFPAASRQCKSTLTCLGYIVANLWSVELFRSIWNCDLCIYSHTRMGIRTNPTLRQIASTSVRRDTEMQLLPSGTTWWDIHTDVTQSLSSF